MSKKKVNTTSEVEVGEKAIGDFNTKNMIAAIVNENNWKISGLIASNLKTYGNIGSEFYEFILKAIPEFLERNPKYASSSIRFCLMAIKGNSNLNFTKEVILPVLEKSLTFILTEEN